MSRARLARVQTWLEELFPERHLYVRSGGAMRGYVLTTKYQALAACGVAALCLWTGVSTAAMVVNAFKLSSEDQEAALTQAKYERWIADRQARLNSAVAQLNATTGSIDDLADDVEKRHAAMAMLLTDMKGEPGAAQALAPKAPPPAVKDDADPMERIQLVRLDQDRMLDAAEGFAKGRADRLRQAFRLAGVNPNSFAGRGSNGLGGPLIEAKDPRALASILDVDEDFAVRISHAAANLSEMRDLSSAAERLPFSRPTAHTPTSSGFGVRFDPFTHRPAFHSGLDFTGGFMSPVTTTAPGVVSFTGVRSGYGNTVEVDHGGGFKTRYAHLQRILVSPGQRVAVGQRIGGMGSTGRSTGVHLHYEVWVNGRAQNPARFVKAGDYVQQTN